MPATRALRPKNLAASPDHVRRRMHMTRLYPTAEQAATLDQQGHAARALWNLLHEWSTWGGAGSSIAKRPSPGEIDRQLRKARISPPTGYEWLGLLPAQATQQVRIHYLRAWDRFFQGLGGARSSRSAVPTSL
jgi:putative transposase